MNVATTRMVAMASIQNSVPRINLRRSTMSPMEPAGRARRKKGRAEAVWISAICRGLLLREVISQAAPTPCMKAPTSETKSAIRRFRNNGRRRGRHGLCESAWVFVRCGIVGDFTTDGAVNLSFIFGHLPRTRPEQQQSESVLIKSEPHGGEAKQGATSYHGA